MTDPPAPPADPRIDRLLVAGPTATCFVTLPGGRFRMGSTMRDDELPERDVTIDAFAVAITPVTNTEYRAFLDGTGHEAPRFWDDPRFNAPDCPVVGVSWFDANAYCEWLGELLGRSCRLPTEAEREYAARGDVATHFPWGDEPWLEGRFALGSQGADRPHPVGSTPPNGFGLYHMAENVHEWCSDWYGKPYDPGEIDDPRGPKDGVRRASRGGSWRHRVKVTRVTARSSLSPERRYNDYGMRVYADIEEAGG
ncbi:MAG: formylglycine-generating enzyme family protein [Chloroflexi bacterium]|nr:formylglycine-generating enzyme family protein [Chloroflexota bacterium]